MEKWIAQVHGQLRLSAVVWVKEATAAFPGSWNSPILQMKFSDMAYITEDILVGEDALSYTSIHVVQQIEVTWTDRFKTQICLLSQSFRNIWPLSVFGVSSGKLAF